MPYDDDKLNLLFFTEMKEDIKETNNTIKDVLGKIDNMNVRLSSLEWAKAAFLWSLGIFFTIAIPVGSIYLSKVL